MIVANTTAQKTVTPFMGEVSCAKHIPYARFVDAETIETKNGNLLQIIKVDGLAADTMDDELIDMEKRVRNGLLMSLTDSSTSFHFHTIRRKINPDMKGEFSSAYLQQLHDKWMTKIKQQDFYINEHYITIIKKPPVGKIRRLADLVNSLSAKWNQEEREAYRQSMIQDLNKIAKQLMTTLELYGCYKLANNSDGTYSSGLSFLSYFINQGDKRFPVPECDLSFILTYKRLFFDNVTGTIAFREVDNRIRYAGIMAIKQYCHATSAGIFDRLLDVKAELIISQVFNPIEKQSIRGKVKEAKRNLSQSDDGETSSSDQIIDVLDELGSSESALGEHQFSLLCVADSQADLNHKLADIDAVMNQLGLIAVREDTGLKAAFFAMLPANHAYLTRKALISTKHMASLASFHNAHHGKKDGNVWGDAITVLETISGSPYYFNFHVMDVGNTFMIGPMGSGKTLIESFLLAESMRFGGRLIAFDKDRGMEVFIRAQGGCYLHMKMGMPTGFAPFQLDDTDENRYYLFRLMRKIVALSGLEIDSEVEKSLRQGIQGAFQLPPSDRTLSNIVPFFGMQEARSLRAAFDNWVGDGNYAWVFDNKVDTLSLDSNVLGFDMTAVLDDTLVASVIYDYLFHRVEQLMDGSRIRIVVAEGWRALQDESFREKIRDWSSTPRKKNAFLVMDTQSPSDIAQSPLACKIIQETVTQIYFANPTAEQEHYVGQFKLSEKEYQIVKSLNKSSRYFLLKQGQQSVVARADLREGFDDDISILSSREKNVRILDQIRSEVGDQPDKWLSLYLDKIREDS